MIPKTSSPADDESAVLPFPPMRREHVVQNNTPGRFFRPELDWLRFFAFAMVFAFHALPHQPKGYANSGLPMPLVEYLIAPLVRCGSHGVDIFFVLSAFLITELLLREKACTGSIHVGAFYVRRALRIWPLYVLFAITVFPVDKWVFENPNLYYFMLAVFLGNWYPVYWGELFSMTGHLWTVAVEEQFYLAWPLLARYFGTSSFRAFLVALFLFSTLYRILTIFLLWPDASPVHHDTFARMDCFAIGGIIALALHNKQLNIGRTSMALLFAMAFTIFWYIGMDPNEREGSTAVWTYSMATIGSAATLVAFLSMRPAKGRSRFKNVFSYLGKISYGLYMWHIPVLFLAEEGFQSVGLTLSNSISQQLAVHFVLTLVLSMLSYSLLERPFLRLKKRYTVVESRPV